MSPMACEMNAVKYEEGYTSNIRGMKLFTCRWLPINQDPKALIFLCHGYAMECSISMKDVGIRLAKSGFAVYGMDYEGHGKSQGLQGFVPLFENLVKDVSDYYIRVCEKKENLTKLRITLGESMGGAVALRLHRLKPEFWDGAILIAPMCKISDELKPNPVVINALTKLSSIVPKWKIVPTQDIIDVAFRNPKVRKEIRENPYCYKGKPRLQTANQLLFTSLDLEKRLTEVKLPFIVLQGEEDKASDPSASKLLYKSATSTDKTLKLYPGMWHSLSYGELPENINIVFADIITWLNDRVALAEARLEAQKKHRNEDFFEGSPSP